MSDSDRCVACITRRQCLKAISSAALSAGLLGERLFAGDQSERIDPAIFRPRLKVRVAAAILRLPPPYWLGWPGASYDLEGHQKEYLGKLSESGHKLGIGLDIESQPVQDMAGVTALLKRVKERPPHGLLVILQHRACWGRVERLVQEAGVPLLVFSPIGTSFSSDVLDISRRPGVYVVSSLEWSAMEAGLRMIRAKRRFEESRILWIHLEKRNDTVLDRLGTKVRAIPRRIFNETFDLMSKTDEVREVAEAMRRGAESIIEPTIRDTLNAARVYTTAKRLLIEEQSNALSMDCLGMVRAKLVPTPPCMAWSLLQDQGITAGCEADLYGATSLMLSSYLLDRPGFINDPIAETSKNLLIAAHCTCGTRLRGFDQPPVPYILRNHSESALGVAMQVLWPVGEPVTLVRFTGPEEVIVDTGMVVDNVPTPPAGGCRTSIEIRLDHVEDSRDVLGFHQVVVLGNHKREVESFCQLYNIRTIHSPEYAPHTQG
jgi:hypothetical protein